MYDSSNLQCSLLISSFTQIQIMSQKRLQIFGLWSQILIPLSAGKEVIQTINISSHGKVGKLYQQSTSPDYAGQSAAAAVICASSKSSAWRMDKT